MYRLSLSESSNVLYTLPMKKLFRIGEIATLSGLTPRTIRYYMELGLLPEERSKGGQRSFSSSDLVYLKRIKELKALGFSLEEIKRIISLRKEDESGNIRRSELLRQYRKKLSDDVEKVNDLKKHIEELEWHIKQLEEAEDGSFRECPGSSCISCQYRTKCIFFRSGD